MKKHLLKLKISIMALSLLMTANLVFAQSEITGTLTTGISGNNGTEMNGTVISAPIANPSAGVYTATQSVSLTASGASSIRYTIDGTVPSCTTGTVYSSNISVDSSMVIEAISCYPENKKSTVASYLYAINIPTVSPVVNPPDTGGGGGGGGGNTPSTPNISTLSPAAQKVDANKDNKVDVLDFVTLMANWGKTGSNNTADFNSDGKVDILDFVSLMA